MSTYSILGLVITILHAILPMDQFNTLICQVDEAPPNDEFYEQVEINFPTDYARENPATAAQAKLEFNERLLVLQERAKEERKKKALIQRGVMQEDAAGAQPLQAQAAEGLAQVNPDFKQYIEHSRSKKQSKLPDAEPVKTETLKTENLRTEEPLMSPPNNTGRSLLQDRHTKSHRFVKIGLQKDDQDSEKNGDESD